MPDTVDAPLVAITSEIVSTYVARHAVPPTDVPALIATVYATLSELGRSPAPAAAQQSLTPAVSVRKSVTDGHLISLEDGKPYQALKRHLTKLGMTPDGYHAKGGGCRPTTRWWHPPIPARGQHWRRRWVSVIA